MGALKPAIIAAFLWAGSAYCAGSTAMDAFNFVTGARYAGMGGAATASVSDPTALQWNPSALSRAPRLSAVFSQLFWVADISYTYAGFSSPLPIGTAGVSLQALNYGPIESTKGLAAAVDAADFGLTAGYALEPFSGLRVGGAMKWFRHGLDEASVNEGALDLAGTYDLIPGRVSVALVVQNVGVSGELEGEAPPLPTSAKAGLSYSFSMTPEAIPVYGRDTWSPTIDLLLAGDVSVYQRGEPAHFSVGMEGVLSQMLFARVGYLQALRSAGGGAGVSMGLGFQFKGLRLDYALGLVGDLGEGHYVTLSWVPPRKPAPAGTEAEKKGEPAPQPVDVSAEYSAGREAYNAGDYGAAIAHSERALAAEPGNWEVWQLLGNCRYAKGDRAGALEAYRRALAVNPDNAVLRAFADQLEKDLKERPETQQ